MRQIATLVIALVTLRLGIVNTYVEWRTYRRDKTDMNVDVSALCRILDARWVDS
jgi:hypothetical protein